MKEFLLVELIGNPEIEVRQVMPEDDKQTVKDKNKKPFKTNKSALIKVYYHDSEGKETKKIISNPTNYTYDGASIPFKIGKGNMKLLIPALFHDLMCEDKSRIDFNRNLSSKIFKDLLIQCKVSDLTAEIMYLAVDTYQRFMKGWKS